MPNLLHIALIYLVVINVVTFFLYGIDKWKAKKSKWRIPEVTLLVMAEGEHYDYLARITKINR